MAYLDTSVLVAALTREVHTVAAQGWLAAQPAEELVISPWTVTEFSAALSMKVRMRHLDERSRAEILSVFADLLSNSLDVRPVASADFSLAARLADRHASGLRAGDALHLAIASRLRERIVSLDQSLVRAALSVGISAAGL